MKTEVTYFMKMCYYINDILVISLNVGFYIFVFFAIIKNVSWLKCNSLSFFGICRWLVQSVYQSTGI